MSDCLPTFTLEFPGEDCDHDMPKQLQTTLQLIQRAFPRGIRETEYLPVLAVLYPHMADENLALVIAEYTGRDMGVVSNDVLLVGSSADQPSSEEVLVRKCLVEAGFEQWVDDDG